MEAVREVQAGTATTFEPLLGYVRMTWGLWPKAQRTEAGDTIRGIANRLEEECANA